MLFGSCDKTEHGDERLGEHTGPFSGQSRNSLAPTLETAMQGFRAVQEIVDSFGENERAFRHFDGVAYGHFFKREKEMGAGLYPNSAIGYFGELVLAKQSMMLRAV